MCVGLSYVASGRSTVVPRDAQRRRRSSRATLVVVAVCDRRHTLEHAVRPVRGFGAPLGLLLRAVELLLLRRSKEDALATRHERRSVCAQLAPRRAVVGRDAVARVRALGAEPVVFGRWEDAQVRTATSARGQEREREASMAVSRSRPPLQWLEKQQQERRTYLRWNAAGHPSQQMSSPLRPQRWHASSFRSVCEAPVATV